MNSLEWEQNIFNVNRCYDEGFLCCMHPPQTHSAALNHRNHSNAQYLPRLDVFDRVGGAALCRCKFTMFYCQSSRRQQQGLVVSWLYRDAFCICVACYFYRCKKKRLCGSYSTEWATSTAAPLSFWIHSIQLCLTIYFFLIVNVCTWRQWLIAEEARTFSLQLQTVGYKGWRMKTDPENLNSQKGRYMIEICRLS